VYCFLPHSFSHAFRQPLRLPKTTEEWDEANLLLQAEVVPAVLQASSSEEKDSILTTRTYEVLANHFGVRPPSKAQGRVQRKLKQHERALKKVTTLKNEARQALHRARREGECMTMVQRLTANFLSLLRTHSRLKRASANRLQLNKKRLARDECHRNFWHYAKKLLDNCGDEEVSPLFSATTAESFFREVYHSNPHLFEKPSWMPTPAPPQPHTTIF